MFKNALNKPKVDLQISKPVVPQISIPKIQIKCEQCRDRGCDLCVPETPVATKPDWSHTPNPASMPQTANDYPRIERVINKQRIDLFFAEKPAAAVRAKMKAQGAWWNDDRKCWEFRDTFGNRGWLEDNFGAEFPEEQVAEISAEPETKEAPKQEPVFRTDAEPVPALAKYRQQVDELIAVLDVRPADLILIAIDFLHAAKVNKH